MNDADRFLIMLSNPALPMPHRAALLRDLLMNPDPKTETILQGLFERLSHQSADALHQQKLTEVDALLKELRNGPLRQGAFLELLATGLTASSPPQALVSLDDGTLVYAVLSDASLANKLRLGDRLVLDGKGRAVLHLNTLHLKVGEEVRFERIIDERHIEISVRQSERSVVFAAHGLMAGIRNGEVVPGASLVINPRQSLAITALPPEDDFAHFKFLDKGPVPDVVAERDIGAPPQCIGQVARHFRQEMTDPERRRRMKLRRGMMKLLCGVSGSGKTLAVQAIHREMYRLMSEITGVPIPDLPPRVFRFRSGQILNQWLGQSDKNVDRFFDEIEKLAGQPYEAPDGSRHWLPCLVIIEEADGLGRTRGQDAIYDRILTGILQRLDPNSPALRDKLVVFLATTNEPNIVDPAFLRRVGGTIEHFHRLTQPAFRAVLDKHLLDLPAQSNNGFTQEQLRRRLADDLTAWFFSPRADETGLVELLYAGSTTPVVKHRRDFLTGALVDRAVQQASQEACDEWERAGDPGQTEPGVTLEQLQRAFDEQIRGLVGQLTAGNADHYLDVPEGARVNTVRRLAQPRRLPLEYRRAQPASASQVHSQSQPQT